MLYKIVPEYTRDEILNMIDQEKVYKSYIGITPRFNKKSLNTYRGEKDPSVSFWWNGNRLMMKDWTGWFTGDIISLTMFLFPLNYYQALNKLQDDFINNSNINYNTSNNRLLDRTQENAKNQKRKVFGINPKKWSDKARDYWRQYFLEDSTVDKFQIHSVDRLFLNKDIIYHNYKDDLCFGYYQGLNEFKEELWKIYWPEAESMRFLTNITQDWLYGIPQLRGLDSIVVTKSLKDVMCFYEHTVDSVSINSETSFPKFEIMQDTVSKYNNKFVLFDNDKPGIKATKDFLSLYKGIGFKPLLIPKESGTKDVSDFRKEYGVIKTLDYIKETILI